MTTPLELKTTANAGTYYPPKVMVDNQWRYLVGVMEWHDHEHDAQAAHQWKAEAERLEEKYAVASLFVKGALEQKIQAEAERDEARAEVERLKAKLADAKDTAARFDAFLTRMEQIFPEAEDRTQLLGCAAETKAQAKELAEALEVAQEAMDDRRTYCQEWAWKYGEVWDEEDAKVRAALAKVRE